MASRTLHRIVLASVMALSTLATVRGEEPTQQEADEAAIQKAVESYVAAFNAADAKALASLWSPNAAYTNPLSGVQVFGRENIEKQFAAIFEESKGAKLEATTDYIDFISPGVAVEHGLARIIMPEEEAPEESEYTAVYVRVDDKWLLDRVTEEEVLVEPSNYEQLQELEWLIGTWIDEEDDTSIVTTCSWTRNRNFMTRMFAVTVGEDVEMSGLQIIGWDPKQEQIRSWVFDSGGGFGEGVWVKKENTWTIEMNGVLADGSTSSSTHIMTPLDDNAYSWQSINRVVAGEMQPNMDEVVVYRQTETE